MRFPLLSNEIALAFGFKGKDLGSLGPIRQFSMPMLRFPTPGDRTGGRIGLVDSSLPRAERGWVESALIQAGIRDIFRLDPEGAEEWIRDAPCISRVDQSVPQREPKHGFGVQVHTYTPESWALEFGNGSGSVIQNGKGVPRNSKMHLALCAYWESIGKKADDFKDKDAEHAALNAYPEGTEQAINSAVAKFRKEVGLGPREKRREETRRMYKKFLAGAKTNGKMSNFWKGKADMLVRSNPWLVASIKE